MGDDQLHIGELPLDLQDLLDIDLVLQTAMAGNVEHADGAHFVQLCQLVLGEEVENTDLSLGQVLGGQVQIGLKTQETTLADLLFDDLRGFIGMGIVQ